MTSSQNMDKNLTAIFLSSMLATACLPPLDPAPTADAGSDSDSGHDATGDRSDADASPDAPDGDPASCSEDTCNDFARCVNDACVIPSVGPPDRIAVADRPQFGSAIAYSEGHLLIGTPSAKTVASAPFDGFRFDEPVPLTTDRINPDVEVGGFGAAIDARGGYAIVGSPDENPLPRGASPDRDGVVRLYKLEDDVWSPYNLTKTMNVERNSLNDDGNVSGSNDNLNIPTSTEDGFATRVAIDFPYFAASAPAFNPTNTPGPAGRVSVWYDLDLGAPPPARVLGVNPVTAYQSPDDLRSQDEFGASILLRDGTLFVGAPGLRANTEITCGGVYMFALEEAQATAYDAKLTSPKCESNNAGGPRFGAHIALQDNTLYVGAPYYDNESEAGAVLVYDLDFDNEGRLRILNFANPKVIGTPANTAPGTFGTRFVPGDQHTLFVEASSRLGGVTTTWVHVFKRSGGAGSDWVHVRSWSPEYETEQRLETGATLAYTPGTLFVSVPYTPIDQGEDEGRVYALDASEVEADATSN